MDVIEYAKWGIRVKEEPMSLDSLHLDKEPCESNFGEVHGGWMCKFPCDAEAALNVATSLPYESLESPAEISPANCAQEDHEFLNFQDFDVSMNTASTENYLNAVPLEHPFLITQKDESAKDQSGLLSNREESDIATSLSRNRETLKISSLMCEKQKQDAALNVQYDVPEGLVVHAGLGNRRESVEYLTKKPNSERSSNGCTVENQDTCSEVALQCDAAENVAAKGNNNGEEMHTCLNEEIPNCLTEEINSLTGNSVVETEPQERPKENGKSKKSYHPAFECPDCGKILKRSSGFITHMKLHLLQLQSDLVPTKCKQCNEEFHDKRSLSLHKKMCTHTRDICQVPSQNDVICLTTSPTVRDSITASEQENSEVQLSSHSQEILQKKAEQKVQPLQKSRCQKVSPLSPKRRRLAFPEECSVTKFADGSSSCFVQNQVAADKAFYEDIQESWSSEIRCKENQNGNSSNSATLSLRLFRFRRPRVVVKQLGAQVTVCRKSASNNLNCSSKDTRSSNLIKERTQCQERNVISNNILNECTSKQLTKESVLSVVNRTSKGALKFIHDSDMQKLSRKQADLLWTRSNCESVICDRSKGSEKYDLQARVSGTNVNEQSQRSLVVEEGSTTAVLTEFQNIEELSVVPDALKSSSDKVSEVNKVSNDYVRRNLVPESVKQLKARSDLKIRIKPVVVLDRLKSFKNMHHRTQKSVIGNTNKCILNVISNKNLSKNEALNANSDISENCNLQSTASNTERSVLMLDTKQTKFDSHSVTQIVNSDYTAQNFQSKNKEKSKNMTEAFVEQSAKFNDSPSPYNEAYRLKPQNGHSNSIAALEKQYCLKKCYVKLSRICGESNDFRRIDRQDSTKTEMVNEVRSCAKLKLRRTSSKLWTVSSCTSDAENLDIVENKEEYVKTADEQICASKNSKQNYSTDITVLSQIHDQKVEGLVKVPEQQCSHESQSLQRSSEETPRSHKLEVKKKRMNSFRSDCTWCQKIFFDEQDLEEHKRTHLSGYKCPQCSAKFHFSMELQAHVAGCSLVRLLNCQKTQSPIKHCEMII